MLTQNSVEQCAVNRWSRILSRAFCTVLRKRCRIYLIKRPFDQFFPIILSTICRSSKFYDRFYMNWKKNVVFSRYSNLKRKKQLSQLNNKYVSYHVARIFEILIIEQLNTAVIVYILLYSIVLPYLVQMQ